MFAPCWHAECRLSVFRRRLQCVFFEFPHKHIQKKGAVLSRQTAMQFTGSYKGDVEEIVWMTSCDKARSFKIYQFDQSFHSFVVVEASREFFMETNSVIFLCNGNIFAAFQCVPPDCFLLFVFEEV